LESLSGNALGEFSEDGRTLLLLLGFQLSQSFGIAIAFGDVDLGRRPIPPQVRTLIRRMTMENRLI
jgi:hypothetical protein